MDSIPLSKPDINEEDCNSVVEVIKSGRMSLGPKVKEFEEKLSKYIGTKYGIAVVNGTAGLHLCMEICGIKENDEVITTPFSFVASANPIVHKKATPVFIDIEEDTFNIDTSLIEDKITEKTKAILPVHIFGLSCDIHEIITIANTYSLDVIEDACEAIGAIHYGKKVGSFGRASVFAFYPNKPIVTGEGGMILTNSYEDYLKFCALRNQGRPLNDEWLLHEHFGFNYRLSDIHCALGISQMNRIDYILNRRKENANHYNEILEKMGDIIIPKANYDKDRSWFVYVVRLEKDINRTRVMQFMKSKGIATQAYFPSIHLQPVYRRHFGYKEGHFPICEKVSSSTIALPFYTNMEEGVIEKVCSTLKEAIKNER